MESEPIKWEEMTSMERNALVAEKVFRRNIFLQDTWGRWLQYHETKPGILEAIPRYSETLEDAWLVVKHVQTILLFSGRRLFLRYLQQLITQENDLKEPGKLIDWPDVFFYVTPELICIAALKAWEVSFVEVEE